MATTLKVKAPSKLTEITLVDDQLRKITSGFGNLETAVNAGAYKIRFENAGAVVDKLITIEPNSDDLVIDNSNSKGEYFHFESSAPVENTLFHHEYHSEPAKEISLQASKRMGAGAEIFIFVRDEFKTEKLSNPAEGLYLWNPQDGDEVLNLAELCQFDGDQHRENWGALTIETSPGVKVLRCFLTDGSMISLPVYACREFQTQVFLVRKRIGERMVIDFDSASIFMSTEGRGFEPEDKKLQLTALAFRLLNQKLSSQRIEQIGHSLTPEIETMFYEKFSNPMLGLFAAHILIRDKEAIFKHRIFLEEVAKNLSRLFGESQPDVLAFKWALGTDDIYGKEIVEPPYLKSSLRILTKESLSRSYLFPYPDGGPCASIASRQIGYGPWLTWTKEREDSRNLIEVSDFERAAWNILLTTIEDKEIADPADIIMISQNFGSEIISSAVEVIVNKLCVPANFAQHKLVQLIDRISRSRYSYRYREADRNWMHRF
jgi:hypothetical protein